MIKRSLIIYRKYLKRRPFGWSGNFSSWMAAKEKATGYDMDVILEKIKTSVTKVKNGEAAYERDGVLFDSIEYSWPLLSAIMWVAAQHGGNIKVLDFGGSLGSTYFQNRAYLSKLKSVQWNIIEQEKFVSAGRSLMQDDNLQFFFNIAECIQQNGKPDLLIISCALQYIEKPYELIGDLVQFNIPYIIVDNTPFNIEPADRITLQKVPPAIYTASYPCWFLDYQKVLKTFEKKYKVISEHQNDTRIELDGQYVPYRGFLLEL